MEDRDEQIDAFVWLCGYTHACESFGMTFLRSSAKRSGGVGRFLLAATAVGLGVLPLLAADPNGKEASSDIMNAMSRAPEACKQKIIAYQTKRDKVRLHFELACVVG